MKEGPQILKKVFCLQFKTASGDRNKKTERIQTIVQIFALKQVIYFF